MTNQDGEFWAQDRIQKIQQIVRKYGEKKFYVSFSGGRDSTALSHLIDEALPDNRIPRVFANTGIEYNAILRFVKMMKETDDRVVIISPTQDRKKGFATDEDVRNGEKPLNIRSMLEDVGYPFKSKEHSQKQYEYRTEYKNPSVGKGWKKYLAGVRPNGQPTRFSCPKCLKYQFTPDFAENGLKISEKCCQYLKKRPFACYAKANGKSWVITGMVRAEGGERANIKCVSFRGDKKTSSFHPLAPVGGGWIKWYIQSRNIEICSLYNPPYNFNRTGCKGCPFSTDLQDQLDIMAKLIPKERAQCERIWKPVYDEYRRIGYRLRSQMTIEDMRFLGTGGDGCDSGTRGDRNPAEDARTAKGTAGPFATGGEARK